jgi:hypothetical protein
LGAAGVLPAMVAGDALAVGREPFGADDEASGFEAPCMARGGPTGRYQLRGREFAYPRDE